MTVAPTLAGACEGDSGGPLLLPEPSAAGGMVQIGVADHVYGECATASPSVFTRVDAISAWVRDWAKALASVPPVPTSPSPPSGTVAAPTLPGIATSRSLTLTRNGVSLVLSCDNEGGVCTGSVEATIGVREKLVVRRGDTRSVSYDRTRTVRLTSVSFAIAPGYSTTVHATLSPQNLTLLSHLGNRPLDVTLTGRGFDSRAVTLKPVRLPSPASSCAVHYRALR